MVNALEKHYSSSNVEIQGPGHNSKHYCPFSGGGDIQIFVESGIAAAVVTTAGEAEPEPVDCPTSPHITPPKANEMRCGSLENKVSGQQTERDATIQLQANMVLTCATLLETRLLSLTSTQELPPLDSLVCYGLLQGPTYSLKLLKLTVDFVQDSFDCGRRIPREQCWAE